MFKRLLAYKKTHNDSTRIPSNCKKDPELACWAKGQRAAYKKKQMSKDHRVLLDTACFVWNSSKPLSEREREARREVQIKQQCQVRKVLGHPISNGAKGQGGQGEHQQLQNATLSSSYSNNNKKHH